MRRAAALLFAAATLAVAPVGPAPRVIDDFETYADGQAIATSASSSPWLRFGMVDDNLYATADAGAVLGGSVSAKIPVHITTPHGGATIARHFDKPTDLSAYATATVRAKSLAEGKSTAALQLLVSDGTTTFVSTEATPITTDPQTITFAIDAKHLERVDGKGELPAVLRAATSIGFRTGNAAGATTTKETIDIDDVTVLPPKP